MTTNLQYRNSAGKQAILLVAKHFAAWGLFIAYELVTIYIAAGTFGSIGAYLLFYSLNISLFYCHALGILPYTFKSDRPLYLTGLLLLLAEIAVYLGSKYAADHFIEGFRLPVNNHAAVLRYVFLNFWRGVYFIGLATVFWIFTRMISFREAKIDAERRQLILSAEKAEVEKRLAEINYAFLQHQINPHFLFNALNLVYSQISSLSDEAASCLLKLTDMLRYSFDMKDANAKADLREEIRHIHDLVEINRLRFDHPLYLEFEEKLPPAELRIIPLILLTLTENVFKHGNLKDPEHPARIVLLVDGNNLLKFETWNLRKTVPHRDGANRVGLINAIKRLRYVYGQRYSLDISDGEAHFGISLSIQL